MTTDPDPREIWRKIASGCTFRDLTQDEANYLADHFRNTGDGIIDAWTAACLRGAGATNVPPASAYRIPTTRGSIWKCSG